jgi:glycine/D-amino acid oxidase-like deaminating enzyme
MAVEALARRHLRPDQVERRPLMPPAGAAGVLRLAYARVDSRKLSVALPAALERAGVRLRKGRSAPLRSGSLPADQVVLAAGAGCRGLWPSLPGRLRVSWAGVLALEDPSARHDLLRALGLMDTGDIVMPLLGGRLHLEQQAEVLDRPAWIVDAGLAPRGEGLLLGQTSLVRPGALCGAPPDATRMERRLRQGLATIDPRLARVPARFHQTPVSFVSHGPPLVGPVAGEPGLWIFAGLSSPFALAPPLATLLAAAIDGDRSALENLPGSGSSASSSWT